MPGGAKPGEQAAGYSGRLLSWHTSCTSFMASYDVSGDARSLCVEMEIALNGVVLTELPAHASQGISLSKLTLVLHPDVGGAITTRVAHFMSSCRTSGFFTEIHIEMLVDLHATVLGIAINL